MLHQEPGLADEYHLAVGRLKSLLRHAQIFEDEDTAVYDRTLLRLPQRPTLVCTYGWRHRNPWKGRQTCSVAGRAQVAVFNPDPEQPVAFTVEAAATSSVSYRAASGRWPRAESMGNWSGGVEPLYQSGVLSPGRLLEPGSGE